MAWLIKTEKKFYETVVAHRTFYKNNQSALKINSKDKAKYRAAFAKYEEAYKNSFSDVASQQNIVKRHFAREEMEIMERFFYNKYIKYKCVFSNEILLLNKFPKNKK
ncbi:MAG: hypothetical protein LBR28_00255 [Bacteroidales bacterium]|jgi:hypothetical protein|nr:hypothetical protein [Bacteroidales bacterium]